MEGLTQCDFCEGKKLTLINKEAKVYFVCPKCRGAGSIYLNENGSYSLIADKISEEKNKTIDFNGRKKLMIWARKEYNKKERIK